LAGHIGEEPGEAGEIGVAKGKVYGSEGLQKKRGNDPEGAFGGKSNFKTGGG